MDYGQLADKDAQLELLTLVILYSCALVLDGKKETAVNIDTKYDIVK